MRITQDFKAVRRGHPVADVAFFLFVRLTLGAIWAVTIPLRAFLKLIGI